MKNAEVLFLRIQSSNAEYAKEHHLDILLVCVEEVHGMSDLIELKLVTEGEAESLHRLQVEAFMPLYEKYQDDDTSPAKESLKRVTEKIIEENSDFYFIVFRGEKVGGVRVRWHQGKKVYENVNWISPIFIILGYE